MITSAPWHTMHLGASSMFRMIWSPFYWAPYHLQCQMGTRPLLWCQQQGNYRTTVSGPDRLFAELKVTAGLLWIVPSTGDKGSYVTVKMDFEDNHMGSNLKILLNKNIFLNGKVCHTLPWVNQSSTPQCTQCLRWGHSRISCQTNFSYCAICTGWHMTSDHRNSILRGKKPKYELACINCLAAGCLTHTMPRIDYAPSSWREITRKILLLYCLPSGRDDLKDTKTHLG